MSWVENFLDHCMRIQSSILQDIPEEKREQGYGRAAKLIVDGPGGCIRELWFSEAGIGPKPKNVLLKNTIYMTVDTLLNLITPDIDLDTLVSLIEKAGGIESITYQLYPRLDFRTALAHGLVIVSGDTADVDSEEFAQIIENFLLKIAFPMVIRGLLKSRRVKSGKRS